MVSIDTALQFVAVSAVLALAPGPDNMFVLMQSAAGGARKGIAVTLGLCTGLVVHTAAVAFGVAAIFQASAAAFTALKIAGAAYLLYLAYGAFTSGMGASPGNEGTAHPDKDTIGLDKGLYQRGILMNVTNPKVALFFLAFLSQFVKDGAGPAPLQILQLGALFMITTLVIFSLVAYTAGRLSRWLQRSPKAVRNMNRIAGVVFIGLAARLITAQR
ncbi:LysE family translocator [Methylobacillus sp. Pita1]|uniref:LysE family translocator n=1 Tax=Methylobacillus sp. Pita1 TaxID=3382642 RepID=UPI0038B4A91E